MKKTVKAGQLVRFIDIPTGTNIIENVDKPKEFADDLKRNCARYYGTAGPAFLEALTSQYENATDIRDTLEVLVKDASQRLSPSDAPPELERATGRFALVEAAGMLGVTLGILPLTQDDVRRAVQVVHAAWMQEAASIPDVVRAVDSVREFILKHRESRFRRFHDSQYERGLEEGGVVRDLVGYWDTSNKWYLLTNEGFKEACNGHDPKLVAAELNKQGFLLKNETGRLQSKHQIPGDRQQLRFYTVLESILAWSINIPPIPATEIDRDTANA